MVQQAVAGNGGPQIGHFQRRWTGGSDLFQPLDLPRPMAALQQK